MYKITNILEFDIELTKIECNNILSDIESISDCINKKEKQILKNFLTKNRVFKNFLLNKQHVSFNESLHNSVTIDYLMFKKEHKRKNYRFYINMKYIIDCFKENKSIDICQIKI